MEMFNVHRRDIMNFDNYMDLKKPGFGGPSSAVAFKDKSGKRVVDNPKLKEFQRVVERDPMFASKHYDSTYKAMTHDVIYKQEKKKPVDYRDPYLTALPVVDISKVEESLICTSFSKFINEQYDEFAEERPEIPNLEEYEEMEEPLESDDDLEIDEPEKEDDFYDEDEFPTQEEPTDSDIDDVERMLKSFEQGGEDYDEYED